MEPSAELSLLGLVGSRKRLGSLTTAALLFGVLSAGLNPAEGQVYLTQEEALELVFPNALSVERKTIFLTDDQREAIQSMARAKVESKIVTYYLAKSAERVLGYAFFETQIVRTMPEIYMAVIDPDGSLRTVEILAFYEQEDYLPSKRWLAQFDKKTLSNDLWVKHAIRNISGATLTAHSIVEGVRRVLATFAVAILKEN